MADPKQPAHTSSTGNGQVTVRQKVNRYPAMPRTYNGKQYYCASDVANILGVSKKTVWQWNTELWNGAQQFTADIKTHDGVYLYEVERVEQLKSVYHPKWMRGGYEPSPTTSDKPNVTVSMEYDNNDKPDGFGHVPKEQFDEEYLRLIKLDLAESLKRRHQMPKYAKRGLLDATIDFFKLGYIPNWILTKSRAEFNCGIYVDKETGEVKHLPPPSERIIVPTASGKHFNAVATPEARYKMPKDFWKQHAGEMELFCDPAALEADTILVVEGEFDAMTIWQVSSGKIAVVAILGAANWKKTLLPKLDDLRGKRFVLMLDADASGKKNANRLLAELLKRGFPTVYRTFYDVLMRRGETRYKQDKKVDVNQYLCDFKADGGNDNAANLYLNGLIQKMIIDDAQAELDTVADEIKQGKYDVPDKPHNAEFSAGNSDVNSDEIKLMLKDFVHAKDLTRDEWWAVGAILFRYGFTVDDFKKWSSIDDPRYDADRCDAEWDSYASQVPELKDDEGYKIGTLIQLAKQNGYEPPRRDPHITGDKTIDHWQEINGVINPELLPMLKTAAEQINGLEHITAANANEISIQRYLGAFRYYSPFAAVDEKFFIRLRETKTAAKKKIAAWSKDNSQPEPTDADKTLAALDIAAINRKVEAYFTQAKRAHLKYIDFSRQKQVTDQREAEHAAYVKNQPTTKGEVANCPVDLILPEGVFFNDEGIKIVDTDKPADKHDDRPVISACQNLVVPTKIFREQANHATQYEVAIQTGKVWRRKVFNGRTLQDARAVSELGNFGAHISEPRMMAKFFAKIIALNENNGRLEEIRSFAQPGWHDDKFSTFAYPTGSDDYVVLRAGFDFKKEFATRGNVDKWKDTFADAMKKGGAVARIFTGFALAAPLVRPLPVSNMQIHLHGDINNGKTALAFLAASIYGNPKMLPRTFDSSVKNRLAVAAAYNDLPTFLDEMETRNNKEAEKALPQSVYTYFTGKANQNNNRDGTPRDPFYFSGARLSTGERPLLSDNDQTGAFKRIVQIRCKKLFQAKYAADIYPVVENNFGHFGRLWTNYVTENQTTIRDSFQSLVTQFTSIRIYEVTQVISIVAAAVAYQYFQICIGTQSSFDKFAAIDDVAEILDELPTLQDISGSERLLRALRSFIDGHPKNFVTEVPSDSPLGTPHDVEAPSFAETYGKIFLNGEVAFYPTALKKIIEKELGFASAAAHIDAWNEEGKLIATGARPNQHAVLICGKKRFTIHFRSRVLSEPKNIDYHADDEIIPPPDV